MNIGEQYVSAEYVFLIVTSTGEVMGGEWYIHPYLLPNLILHLTEQCTCHPSSSAITIDSRAIVPTPSNHLKCPTLDSFVRGMQGHRGYVG